MRWLQWATIDLESGLGGVEVHARSVARELRAVGIDCKFSRDPRELDSEEWDVIHTHGSAFLRRGRARAIHVHTLHGTTLGRMAACSEWTWPGGYLAALREWRAVQASDIVMAIHPNLWLYRRAKKLGKSTEVCWNGWDSLTAGEPSLSAETREQLRALGKFWAFVGRGSDPVKGAARLRALVTLLPDFKWAAAPGDGFERCTEVFKTGPLSVSAVREMMQMSSGLLVPSLYEGLPLVLLEALSEGVPVVATRVGGIPTLPEGLAGLFVADAGDSRALADALRRAQGEDTAQTEKRKSLNRSKLPTWASVARIYRQTVERFRNESANG